MATAAREDKKQPYQGTGGKFRKTPFRRNTQSTPYDRPPAAAATLRNPSIATGGWISKLVDPAQRLLTYSAHRLFSSVFTKRLPPPPPPTETSHEAKSKGKEEVGMDPPGVQRYAIDQSVSPSTTPDGNGFTLLEQILEQKTFTRPEIDRMKELLHSRTVDIPHENQEKRSEVLPSKAVASHDRKEESPKTPLQDKNGINSHFVSTPVVSTSVLDEGVSPVELAKAYMSSRASKVSPSMLGVLSQAPHEKVHVFSSVPNSSKLPLMSASKICGNGGAPENGFATPRSRGRSAICSMAQTPYSRVRTNSTVKGVGSTYDTHGWMSSSSQSVQEQSQLSGSKQGALKRRFSVLDNDIGSVGPTRRIRLKPNLVSSRDLSTPISSSAVSIHGTRLPLEAAQNSSSSMQKPLWLCKSKHTPAKALSENGIVVPSTSFSTVPSQSSKTASKIFEHLDKITSSKEKLSEPKDLPVRDKSPSKLSQSMLRGQALKSLEDVDSSRYLENVRGNTSNNMDISSNLLKTDATKKDDKVKENGPSQNIVPSDTSAIITNGAASDAVALPPANERAFKMSAHEYLELDDDDDDCSAYVAGSGTFSDGRVKVDKIEVATQDKLPAISEIKPPAYSEVKSPSSFERNPMADTGISYCVHTVAAHETNSVRKPVESDTDGKSKFDAEVSFRVPEAAVSSSSEAATTSINATATPLFDNLASQKSSEVIAFSAKTNSVDNNATTSAIATSSSSLFNSVSASPPPAEHIFKYGSTAMLVPANSSLELLGDTNKIDGCVANPSGTYSAGTSAMSASVQSTFGFPASAVNLSNSTSLSTGSGSGLSTEASPGLIWSFGPSTASTAVMPGISDLESSRVENKQGGTFGTVSSASYPGTSATSASSAISSFGASVPASTPTSTQQSLGTIFSGGSGSGTNVQVLPGGTGVGSITETAPAPGSSASGFAFSFTGNTALSSGSSALGASTASEASLIGSNAGGSSKLFSAGWQPATSSKFASTISSTSSSPGFQFSASSASAAINATLSVGVSSGSAATSSNATTVLGMPSASAPAPAPTTSSLPVTFRASTVSAPSTSSTSVFGLSNGASSAHTFSFGSPATTTTPSQPAFSNPIFGFPTAPSGNNDQTSMEDSMAEDTIHASAPTFPRFGQQPVSAPQPTPTLPVFGQEPVSAPQSAPTLPVFGQQPVSAPQSALTVPVFGQQPFSAPQSTSTVPVFGQHPVSAPHSAPNVFGQQPVSTPQSPFVFGSNTGFQFQSQPNLANSQTPSIFQASSSLGLSTGGGGSEGNFSLGSGGGDKSNRRFIKANRSKNRKK